MTCRGLILTVLFCALPCTPAEDTAVTVSEDLGKRIERILATAGISFHGEFRSGYFGSVLWDTGKNTYGRTKETDEYSSVDFDIHARPNDAVACRLIFRMHHNWPNFWSSPGNPIFSRWISIDGKIGNFLP